MFEPSAVSYVDKLVTGITDGEVVRSVRYGAGTAVTDSIVMRARSGTVRRVTATHRLDRLAEYSAVDYEHPTPAMAAGIHMVDDQAEPWDSPAGVRVDDEAEPGISMAGMRKD